VRAAPSTPSLSACWMAARIAAQVRANITRIPTLVTADV
jgi:hypothetical protein